MNKKQEQIIKRIKEAIPHFDYYGSPEKYEIKNFEVKDDNQYFVTVSFTTGMKNDEGTMASIVGRKHRFVMIGRKGGIKVPCKRGINFKRVSLFTLMNECYTH